MRMDTKTLLAGVGCVAAFALAPQAGAALISNGDFETPGTGTHAYGVNSELGNHNYGGPSFGSDLPTDWTRTGTRNWTVNDEAAGSTAFPAANGHYAVRLDANSAGGVDRLEQTGINLVAGTEYTFSIDMWSESAAGGSVLNVELFGTGLTPINVLSGYTDAVAGVETVTANFTATETGSFTISLFAPQTTASNNHTWIDNVSLDVVPEPGSLALLGLGGLMIARRRRG